MPSNRPSLINYMRISFWSYRALGSPARRLLIILVAVILLLDSLFRATNNGATTVLSAVVTTAFTLAVALFVWKPPVATLTLIATIVVAAFTGVFDSLIAGAAILGLVAFTCSTGLIAVYALAWVAWLIAAMTRSDTAFQPLGAVVIALMSGVSLVIGVFIRQQYERAQSLATQLEATEREVADQLRHERDLIADELHDIVAHEITIVALHAAVLERTDDAHTRTQSQTAIREAAVQALTDIRRVLGMVRGEENLAPERIPSADSLPETIATVTEELGRAGIRVTADVPDDLRLPSASHVALVRVIRESSTNVLKHATGARTVRITLAVERGWTRLEFADDSPPARTAGLPASGYGIMRLQERFRLFGGSFSAERRPSGWVVSASLPLEA
ncbi:sensor histidine kinase [Microbacterium dextranolyticum]|uniref:histidine kinase n=1 Tax=Microbacterium dextranolyticum TaxID=36806 RepID=A0A9W6M6I2_9MICO|nr:histidine kinase [Microbacterium dextranolyticum]MBM7462983.1 signal transduction histidine kinase [Microbacterium dextranolyticum]GLJ95911.1 two-component sensor histidine kinase [Microbacterium dextranolyticum]